MHCLPVPRVESLRLVLRGLFAIGCCSTLAIADEATVKPIERFADPVSSPVRIPFEAGKFALREHEVVVFTGSANGVFEQQQGWLESLLAASAKTEQPCFRHMCWEGDTVYEQWRAMNFGSWAEQFEAVGASTIVLWFGQNEALDDSRSASDFASAYGKLLDEFGKHTPRLVVISPPPFEKPRNPWIRDNTARNERVKEYSAAARRLAAERGAVYVDIFTPLAARPAKSPPLTEDGVHFSPAGQKAVAEVIAKELGVTMGWSDGLDSLRQEVVAKNRLWFDCWRTMNWYFAYGDRTWAIFATPAGGHPSLAKELEQFKPLIRAADARIHAVALGQSPPEKPAAKHEPLSPPRPPEEELETFTLRDGFEINLFASENDGLVKPTQMVWDERGRMWTTCSPSYPQVVPGAPPTDYVLVCEDTDGDGRVDRSFKFAEGLVMPTGLALGDGGVYVCENTQLIHLRDSDGDDKADQRRVVYSGFGTGDTHQSINTLQWGPDGRLWFTQGLHIYSLIETSWGLSRCFKAGVWRMNPRSLELQNFLGNAAASENGWGVGFDAWGQTFYTPGNELGTFFITPALVPLAMEQLQQGQYKSIGKLAATGAKSMRTEFLNSRHLPDDLQGVLAKSTYLAGYVELSRLEDNGSGFKSELIGNLISSSSTAFRPIETRVGPDGAIYVCDWYNPIVNHYGVSYRDPQRDHVHGRIWRITAKGRPLSPAPMLAKMNHMELLDQLGSPDRWVRDHAQRLLADRPAKEVIAAADQWITSPGFPPSANAAILWYGVLGVYAAHEAVRPGVLQRALESSEPRLRAFGTHMIGIWASKLRDPLVLLRKMATDDFPRVRLEAIVAASYVPLPQSVEVATFALAKDRDPFIDYSLTQTVRMLKPHWLAALGRGELTFDHRPERLQFVLEADGTKDVVAFIPRLIENSELEVGARERMLKALVDAGSPDDLRFALDQGKTSIAVLNELALIAKIHKRVPTGELTSTVQALLSDPDNALRVCGLRLAAAWHIKDVARHVRQQLQEARSSAIVAAAVEAAVAIEGKEAIKVVEPFTGRNQPAEIREAAIAAISAVDLDRAAILAVGVLDDVKSESEMSQIILPIIDRREGGKSLAKALEGRDVSRDSAKLAIRVLVGMGSSDTALLDVLNRSIGLQTTRPEYSPELVTQLVADAAQGNGARGRDVYLSKLANCDACHKVAGKGGDIGPELSVLGKAMQPELIVESLLWPNRRVKEGFGAIRVLTSDGHVFTGYKQQETPDEIHLRDTSVNQTRRIAKADIEETANAGSVMPDGITAGMTADELRDLIRYLSELGQPGSAK